MFCKLRPNLRTHQFTGSNSILRRKVLVVRLKKALRSGVRHVLASVARTG